MSVVTFRATTSELPSLPRNLNVYDLTTGEIRSNTTDKIACRFTDADCNEESFFVIMPVSPAPKSPTRLFSSASRLIDPPPIGKITVKATNHYGDKVLSVYQVQDSRD